MRPGKPDYANARKLLATAISTLFAPLVFALPVAPTVANGNASFVQSGNALTVTNSNGAIINWNAFSIGSDETVRFIQTSSTSSVLNRVLGSDPSVLLGSLQSNGRVFLINPAGILVGQGARIDVAGFVASTLSLSDSDFLANRLRFTETAGAGKVQNFGEITTPSGGNVYLVAPQVENHGIITAPNGEVLLAAGQRVELFDTATPGVRVEIIGSEGSATNLGTITAEAGRIGIAGVLVRNSGTLNASSLVSAGGRIFLKATQTTELAAGSLTRADGTQGGTIQVDSGDTSLLGGTVSASGSKAGGGYIELLGDKVGILDGARLDASGETGGGTVLAGGDYQGRNADIRNAEITFLAEGASVRADARGTGNGGKIIFWADDTTRAYGSISARGGAQGGNGGFIEVSGKRSLDFAATVDTSAPFGRTGTLLLDPNSLTIYDGPATPIGGTSWTESGGGSTLQWSTIDAQLQSTNVTITTTDSGGAGDDIVFSNAYGPMVASATATNTLALNANDKIVFNQNLDLKGGLQATAGSDIDINATVRSAGSQIVNGWNINISAGATNAAGLEMTNAAGSQSVTAGGSLNIIGGSGAGTGAYLKSAGSQTVSAAAISLAAGNSFTSNSAIIDALGNQSITTTSGDLTLSGSTDAQAEISSNSSQTISVAGNAFLTGGAGASAGAAMITAPVQDINIAGNLTMNAGTGSTLDTYGMAAAAVIGWDAGANIDLDVTGTISLNGNNATNQAVIGAAIGAANVDISANAITTTAYTAIGNWDGSMGGSVDLVATSGAISLPANSTLRTGTLVANAGSSLSIIGNNFVNNVTLTASGPVTYRTANSGTTHIASVNTAGNIAIYGDAGSSTIALGTVTTAGGSTILVESQKAILDDNGSGVANVSTGTGNITLTSLAGTAVPGELAISTDVATGGTLTANVSGGPNGSIGIRDVGANQVGSAFINAASATAQGNVDYFRYGNLSLTGIAMSQRSGDNYRIGASGDITVPAGGFLLGSGAGLGTLSAGGNLTVTSGILQMRSNDNSIKVGGTFSIGNTVFTDPGQTLSVSAGAIQITGGTLSANGDLKVQTPGSLSITGGGSLSSVAGSLDFIVDGPMNVTQGSISAALGIVGDANNGLTLGAAAGGSGVISANNGVLDLAVGGSGIEMFNGSYLNSTDATQPAGGLIEIFFAGLPAGGSLIDGVATFDGGYKVGGALTTLGAGLEVTYGLLSSPVSDALVAAINSTTDSAGGTSQTSDSLALIDTATTGGSAGTIGTDATLTTGGGTDSFGSEEPPAESSGASKDNSQDGKNAKKKPAQCSA